MHLARAGTLALLAFAAGCTAATAASSAPLAATPRAPASDSAQSRVCLGTSEQAAACLEKAAHNAWITDRLTASEALLSGALQVRRALRDSPAQLGHTLASLARVYVQQARFQEARAAVVQGMAPLRPGKPDDDSSIYDLQMALGQCAINAHDLGNALTPFAIAADAAARGGAAQLSEQLGALDRLATSQAQLGLNAESLTTRRRAMSEAEHSPELTKKFGNTIFALAHAYAATGALNEALALLARYEAFERVWRVTQSAIEDGFVHVEPLAPPAPAAQPRQESGKHTVNNASRIVAEMREGFRVCYQTGLIARPRISGTVTLEIRVDAAGLVSKISGRAFAFSREVVDCMLYRAASAQFEPPAGGTAIIEVPVTFVLSSAKR